MHLNNAEIFGVESLSLNKHFSKPIDSNEQNNFEVSLHLPEQLQNDLAKAIESLNIVNEQNYSLVAQEKAGYDVVQTDVLNVSICFEGLSIDHKKQLWQALSSTLKVNSDNL